MYEQDDYSYQTRSQKRAEKESEKGSRHPALSWILCIAIAVAAAFCIRGFIAEPIRVEGRSMNPSLYSDQTLLVEKVSRYFELPERGNIVIVHYPDSTNNYVKRVIGLPGERIRIENSTVYINDAALLETYTSKEEYADMEEITVPEDSIFVMGDNRAHSQDSRFVGPIPHDSIVGTAVSIIWPVDQAREIKPGE